MSLGHPHRTPERGQVIKIRTGAKGRELAAFIRDRSRHSGVRGPYGSGKSIAAAQKILDICCEQEPNARGIRPTRGLITRTTERELMSTTYKDWEVVWRGLGRLTSKGGAGSFPTFKYDFFLQDRTRVEGEAVFVPLDREDAIGKIRGHQPTWIWVNEASNTAKYIIDEMDLRLRRYPNSADNGVKYTWSGMILDTNSMPNKHWWYQLAEVERPKGWKFFSQPGGVIDTGEKDHNGRVIWERNPDAENLSNLHPDYYIDGCEGKTDDWIRVMLGNEYGFVQMGKPVHPEYVDSVHCAREPIAPMKGEPLWLGIDFGRTPAAAILQRHEGYDRWYCIDEVVTDDMSAALFGPMLKRYIDQNYPGYRIASCIGDPSGDHAGQATEDVPIDLIRSAGIPCEPAATNSEMARRRSVSGAFARNCADGRPALVISPKCAMIREGLMGGFCFRRLRVSGEYYTERPDKNEYSHPVEALEYALLGGGEYHMALEGPPRLGRQPIGEYAIRG